MRWFGNKKNKRYDNDLYRIVGEPEARETVAKAVEWLRSPAMDGLGEQLLQRARRLHKRQLAIDTNGGTNCYENERHRVELSIDLSMDPSLYCIEAIIAHELVHAGDPQVRIEGLWPPKWKQPLNEMTERAFNAVVSQEDQEQLELLKNKMKEAPDYRTGCAALKAYVNRHMEIMKLVGDKRDAALESDPKYVAFVAETERPAMEAENRVLKRLGLPARKLYSENRLSDEYKRNRIITRCMEEYGIDSKPGGPGIPLFNIIVAAMQMVGDKRDVAVGTTPTVHFSIGVGNIEHRGHLVSAPSKDRSV